MRHLHLLGVEHDRRPSPGHQAGAPLRRDSIVGAFQNVQASSPGHQAGAPLRHLHLLGVEHDRRPSPGHQAGAPLRRQRAETVILGHLNFPRPSGRGSIAASRGPSTPDRGRRGLPPAIRPGSIAAVSTIGRDLVAAFPRPSGRGSIAAWRRQQSESTTRSRLPPAIRPGLHCGDARRFIVGKCLNFFPRPSGRGSIAALCR